MGRFDLGRRIDDKNLDREKQMFHDKLGYESEERKKKEAEKCGNYECDRCDKLYALSAMFMGVWLLLG